MSEAQGNRQTGGMALVCLGWVAWGRSWKRNQSMFYQLSQRDLFERAVFVNPKAMWLSDQFRSEEGTVSERLLRIRDSLPHAHGPKIRIASQWHFVPFKGRIPAGRSLEDWLFRLLLRRFTKSRPYVLLVNHPNFYSPRILAELMEQSRLTIFDLSDDFVEFFTDTRHRELFRNNIEQCCRGADLVFAVNQHVANKYGQFNPETHVIPNSTNFSNFHRDAYEPVPWLERVRRPDAPLLGCTGIINRVRIDYDLLEWVVTSRPEWQFVFVGSADPSFLDLAARHPNMHHHPQVPYEELPNWIHGFDAAIIPFRINEHTRGNDLLKFHDYLAMGKGVATTDTGGASRFADLIEVGHSREGFLAAIERAMQAPDDELRERRIDMARRNSWSNRAGEIERLIREQLERGK